MIEAEDAPSAAGRGLNDFSCRHPIDPGAGIRAEVTGIHCTLAHTVEDIAIFQTDLGRIKIFAANPFPGIEVIRVEEAVVVAKLVKNDRNPTEITYSVDPVVGTADGS